MGITGYQYLKNEFHAKIASAMQMRAIRGEGCWFSFLLKKMVSATVINANIDNIVKKKKTAFSTIYLYAPANSMSLQNASIVALLMLPLRSASLGTAVQLVSLRPDMDYDNNEVVVVLK